MKFYENDEMKVEMNGNDGVVTMKKFGDTYSFKIDDNGRTIAYSALGLKRAMKARNAFGF